MKHFSVIPYNTLAEVYTVSLQEVRKTHKKALLNYYLCTCKLKEEYLAIERDVLRQENEVELTKKVYDEYQRQYKFYHSNEYLISFVDTINIGNDIDERKKTISILFEEAKLSYIYEKEVLLSCLETLNAVEYEIQKVYALYLM